jgi:hypothetical protein
MKATRSGNVIGMALADFVPTASSTSASSTGAVGGSVLVYVQPGYQTVNNTFVFGENDGQLNTQINADGTQQINTDASSTPTGMLIDQRGIGTILQLQQNGQNRIVFGNAGDFSIMASTTIASTTLLSVSNSTTSLFTINARGDLFAKGHITVGHDTAGTATVNPGDDQVTVTFDYPYNSVPKVVVTMQGMPSFFYGVTQKDQNSFTITMSQPATEPVFFDWVALEQPNDTTSVSGQSLNVVQSPSNGGSGGSYTPPPTDLSGGQTPEGDVPVGTEVGPSQSGDDNGEVAGESTTSTEPENPPTEEPTPPAAENPPVETPPVTDSGETAPTP